MPTTRAPEGYAAAPGSVQVAAELLAEYDPDAVTLNDREMITDWEEARKKLGWSRGMALCAGALRLILWHALQPLAYAATLWAFYQRLDPVQQILACIVLGREALFLLLLAVACRVCPAFLLVNVAAKKNNAIWQIMFVLCPEKWIAGVVGGDRGGCGVVLIVGLCDLCSLGGLILGIVKGDLPVPLGISYGVTTLAGFAFAGLVCATQCQPRS